jgi:transcriptional regulator
VYQPPQFREDRLEVQHALIRAHPLGALVTVGPAGLVASHIPFLVDAGASPFGTLRAHLARANGHWQELASAPEALVIFQGVESYITPAWYQTKRETGKVVPTWNYAVVHVYGRPRIVDDPAWVARHVAELTALNERGRSDPWSVSDAPADFIAAQLKGIVGLEIAIARLEGTWKVSQNRPPVDRDGVIRGLTTQSDERSLRMAQLVEISGTTRESRS